MKRLLAMIGKELTDLRLNPGVFVPSSIAGLGALVLPFIIAVVVPAVTGEPLAGSSDFEIAVELYQDQPGTRALDAEGAIQGWIFQQFLMFLILIPVVASTSIASDSIVSEKKDRTLEPLLATPIRTSELLAAKVISAYLPALTISTLSYLIYFVGIATFARPGVYTILFLPRSLAIAFLLGPLAVLAALQVAVCVSSRVEDARTAQQYGSLVALPFAGLFMAPILGIQALTMPLIFGTAAIMLAANALLLKIAIRLFDREAILTKWK